MKSFASARRSARNFCARFLADESGTPAIEFGILAPVFFMLLFSVMQISLAYFKGATIQWAVDRAVRVAMINSAATADDVRAAVNSDLAPIGSPTIEFHYVIDNTGAVPLAHVTAHYGVPVTIPMVPTFTVPFTVDSYVPVPSAES